LGNLIALRQPHAHLAAWGADDLCHAGAPA